MNLLQNHSDSILSASAADPIILSTYDQLSKVLRKYRATIDERIALEQAIEEEEATTKKPVVFPKNPTFDDIIKMLEQKNREKRRNKYHHLQQAEDRNDEVLPEIELETFF